MAEPVPPSGRKSPATPAVIETKPAKGVWTADQLNQLELHDGEPSRRSFAAKMFHVTPWGWIKLAGLCLAVGAVLQASGVNPFEPGFTLSGAAGSLGRALINTALWALTNGWAPALIGAAIVLPLWLLWRLLSVPFRR